MQILPEGAFGFIKNLKSREQIKKSAGQLLLVEKDNARIHSKFVNIKKYLESCFFMYYFFFNKITVVL